MNNIDTNARAFLKQGHTNPLNEEKRIQELYRYEIMATLDETDFDTITLLAAEVFNTPYAAVNFVDTDEVFSKVAGSTVIEKARRTESLSAKAILDTEITVFQDLPDELSATDTGEIRFYAAAPLISPNGFAIGTVSVSSTTPQPVITDGQLRTLKLIAVMVIEKLENRLSSRNMVVMQNQTMRRLVHDIKNPMTSISLYTQLLIAQEMPPEKVSGMAEKIGKSLLKIETSLNNVITNRTV